MRPRPGPTSNGQPHRQCKTTALSAALRRQRNDHGRRPRGDEPRGVLNKMLAKTAFVRRKDGGAVDDAAAPGDLEWRDGVSLARRRRRPRASAVAAVGEAFGRLKDGVHDEVPRSAPQDVHGDVQAFWWDKTGARCTTTLTTRRLGRLLQDGRRPAPPLPAGLLPDFARAPGRRARRVPRDSHVRLETAGRRASSARLDRRQSPNREGPQQAPDWVQRDRVFAGKYDAEEPLHAAPAE